MPKVQIVTRLATSFDAAEIAELHCASWRDAYANVLDPAFLAGPIEADRRALWSSRLEQPDPRRITLIGEEAGSSAVVGFGCAYADLDPVWGSWIDNLHVRPEARGNGAGRQIIDALATIVNASALMPGIHLWVFEANEAALRFYLRLGGAIVGHAKSQIPAANGATVLRVFWADRTALVI